MRASAVLVAGMFRRELTELRRYAFNTVAQLLTVFVLFLLVFFGAKSFLAGADEGGTLSAIVVGFMVWTLAISTYGDVSFALTEEATAGTLEQLAMSPFGLPAIMLVRFLTNFVVGLAVILSLLLMMMASTGRWLHLDLASVLPLLFLTAVGVQGFAFILGGVALVAKRIQAFLQVVQFGFVALVALSPHRIPWLKLAPVAWGNHLISHVMVDRLSLSGFGAWDLLTLGANAIGWMVLGLLCFKRFVALARDRALLGHY